MLNYQRVDDFSIKLSNSENFEWIIPGVRFLIWWSLAATRTSSTSLGEAHLGWSEHRPNRPKSSGISSCSPLKWPTLYVGYTTFPYISRFEYTDNHWYTVPLSLQKHWQSLGWDEWWGPMRPMRPMRPMLDSEVHDVLTSADDKHLYIASSPGKLLSLRVGWIYTIHMYIVYVYIYIYILYTDTHMISYI